MTRNVRLATKTTAVTIVLGLALCVPLTMLYWEGGGWGPFGIPALGFAWWFGVQEAVWRFKEHSAARVSSELLAAVSLVSAFTATWALWAIPVKPLYRFVAIVCVCWAGCYLLLRTRGPTSAATARPEDGG